MEDIPSSMVILFIILLCLSAFFSSAETAYSSVNKIRLQNYEREGRKGAGRALHIANHFDQVLSTILVGNNLVNIAAATISSQVAIQIFGPSLGTFISTFVVTLLVLIFGEILPKSFAKENAETLAVKISGIMLLLIKAMTPITWFFIKLKEWMSLLLRNKEKAPSITEEEIKVMVQLSEDEGVIDEKERELVQRSLEFDEIVVKEILKPRTDIIAVGIHQSVEEMKEVFFQERYSRIPVYEGNIDNVIGILYERDFLTAYIVQKDAVDVRALLRKPYFVAKSMKVSALLPELQKQKVHMAIVIDEFGGTSGLITLEDILEELVGEIWDEHDESVKMVRELSPSNYLFFADYSIEDFAKLMKVELPDTLHRTLGGWIIDRFQRVPVEGEQFTYENLLIRIVKAEEERIRQVHVTVQEQPAEQSF